MSDEEESKLFRDTVGPVVPVISDQVPYPRNSGRPRPRPRHEPTRRAVPMEPAAFSDSDPIGVEDRIYHAKAGVQRNLMRKLSRGRIPYQAAIDLHGLSTHQADLRIAEFIKHGQGLRQSCILVIHGKGYGSSGRRSILKNYINRWLMEDNRVLAYCSALPRDGGSGALYVLLKSKAGEK